MKEFLHKIFLFNLKIFLKNFLFFFSLFRLKKEFIKFDDSFCLSKIDNNKYNIIEGYPINDLINLFGQRLESKGDPFLNILYSCNFMEQKKDFVNFFKKKIKTIFNENYKVSDILQSCKSKKLSKFPWWTIVLPWDEISIEDNFKQYIKRYINNKKSLKKIYYQNNNLDKTALGNKIFYNDLSWEFHALKFYRLYKSVFKYGFDKTSAIPVNIFIYKNSCRFGLSDDGNHRIRVAHILNFKTVPLKISKFIYFNDFRNWKNVKNGTYSVTQAKKIFFDYYNHSNKNIFNSLLK
jgi:hypothetical protein